MWETIVQTWTSNDLAVRTIEHLTMFSIALILAILGGMGIGLLIFRYKRVAQIVLTILNLVELIPTLALLILLLPVFGLGAQPTIAACVLYSLLPIARNTYTGLISVNKEFVEVAQGLGLSPLEILVRIRLPFSLPLVVGGIRIAIVFTMGVVTLGGLIAAGGLGAAIQLGINRFNVDTILVAGLWVGVLAVLFDGIASGAEKLLQRRYSTWQS